MPSFKSLLGRRVRYIRGILFSKGFEPLLVSNHIGSLNNAIIINITNSFSFVFCFQCLLWYYGRMIYLRKCGCVMITIIYYG